MRLFLVLALLFVSLFTHGQLNGVYTIGGVSPNYSTISAAVGALNSVGVSGSVEFKIRPGKYNESVTIDTSIGGSPVNKVVFRKDLAFAGEVHWFNTGIPLKFENAQFITIRDLTIESTGDRVIFITGETNNINIVNNLIRGYQTHSASYCVTIVGHSVNNVNNVSIDSNTIRHGAGAVFLGGGTSNRNKNNKISNNICDSSGYNGFNVAGNDSVIIRNNIIRDNGVQMNTQGIRLNYCSYFKVEANTIYQLNTNSPLGIDIANSGGSSSNHAQVSNNFLFSKAGLYGIRSSNSNEIDYSYNTIRLEGVNSNSRCVSLDYGRVYLKNNIFSNHAGGRALYIPSRYSLMYSNFNDFYSTDSSQTVYAGNSYLSFSSYQSQLSKDTNSVSVHPKWTTLEGYEPSSLYINDAAEVISTITTDIIGKIRGVNPDIGCFEFKSANNDAGLDSVLTERCEGVSTVRVKIKNHGLNPISQVVVNWNLKTGGGPSAPQTSAKIAGLSIPVFGDTIVEIGTMNFLRKIRYELSASIDSVNGVKDSIPRNDTAHVDSVFSKMSGAFTVGGINPDFSNVLDALAALQKNDVCGPVIFNIRPGEYYGRHTLFSVEGVDSINTVLFQSDTSFSGWAHLTYRGAPLQFYGVKYYTFKNLKFSTTRISSVVNFSAANEGITFLNDSLVGTNVNTSIRDFNSVFYQSSSSSGVQKNLVIKHCVILNGSRGIHLIGNGGTGIKHPYNVEITNNKILGFYYTGVFLYNTPHSLVHKNIIDDNYSHTSGNGVFVQGCVSTTLSANKISIRAGNGVDLRYNIGTQSTDAVRMFNNFIFFKDTSGANLQHGIRGDNNNYLTVAFNSVKVSKGTNASTAIYMQSGLGWKIVNNNFSNFGTGLVQQYGNASGVTLLNHNNSYYNGTNLGFYNGTVGSLSAWRTATGQAGNSKNVHPQFYSFSDLHTNSLDFDGQGTPVPDIQEDIDGHLRNTTSPDIGADEFTIFNNDASIVSINESSVCGGNNPVFITLRNVGTNTLNSTTIGWKISTNGGAFINQPSYNYTGTLATSEDTSINIGSFQFLIGTNYQIQFYTTDFNGLADQNLNNDSIKSVILKPKMSGVYTVGNLPTDDWQTIDSAITQLELNGVCGPTTIYIRAGTYAEASRITNIPGANKVNDVLILGDTNGTKPTWVYGFNAILGFVNTGYITFKNIKFSSTSNFHSMIDFNGNNEHIHFIDNEIIGRALGIHGGASYLIDNNDQSNTQTNYCSFINNDIFNGNMIIRWHGNSTSHREKGNKFIGNRIFGAHGYGVQIFSQDSLEFRNNYIKGRANITAFGIGLNVHYTSRYKITGNRIEMPSGNYGMHVTWSSGIGTDTSLIANNFVSVGGNSNGYYGISVTNCHNQKLVHNSVNMYGTGTSSFAFYLNGGSDSKIMNNSFVNSVGGPAIGAQSTRTGVICDYNNLWTLSTQNFSFVGGQSYQTSFAQWRLASGYDANSIQVPPNYLDSFDLHVNSNNLNRRGFPVGILFDIDGDLRSMTTPDIGADEIVGINRDVELMGYSFSRLCNGKTQISINFNNRGYDTLKTTTFITTLSINGGMPTLIDSTIFNGALPENHVATITLDSVNLNKNDKHVLSTYSHLFNNLNDEYRANDTIIDSLPLSSIPMLSGLISAQQVPKCYGDTTAILGATVSGGVSPFVYSWSNGDTTSIIHSLSGGTYMLTVSDSSQCADTVSFTLIQPDSIGINLKIDSILKCFGDSNGVISSNVQGGVTPYNYTWLNQKTTSQVRNLHSGLYVLTVTDSNKCVKVDSLWLVAPNLLSSTVDSIQHVTCEFGANGKVKLATAGGTPPYSYLWNNGKVGAIVDSLNEGKVSVLVSDSLGCRTTVSDSIAFDFTNPAVQLGNDTSSCSNKLVWLDAQNNGSNFLWNTGDTIQSILPLKSGSYSVIVTDNNGCKGFDTVSIVFNIVCVGIEEISKSNQVVFYPNPNSGSFRVRFTEPYSESVNLSILDARGRLIREISWAADGKQDDKQIDLSDQQKGLYFLQVTLDGRTSLHRILIK